MTSPPGTYVITSSNESGQITVTINFDPATKDLVNRGTPSRCLVADNGTSIPWPCTITTPQGTFQVDCPVGHTDFTANQITNASGISNLTDITFGV